MEIMITVYEGFEIDSIKVSLNDNDIEVAYVKPDGIRGYIIHRVLSDKSNDIERSAIILKLKEKQNEVNKQADEANYESTKDFFQGQNAGLQEAINVIKMEAACDKGLNIEG